MTLIQAFQKSVEKSTIFMGGVIVETRPFIQGGEVVKDYLIFIAESGTEYLGMLQKKRGIFKVKFIGVDSPWVNYK